MFFFFFKWGISSYINHKSKIWKSRVKIQWPTLLCAFKKKHLFRYFIFIERNNAIWDDPSVLVCSCLDALRHPFLCGPRWRVVPSMDIIRWGLGSTAVRITEEYIYGQTQVMATSESNFLILFSSIPPHRIDQHCFILLVAWKPCQ